MKEIQAIGVYCSSYEGIDEVYKEAAQELGDNLAKRKITMVYGGGSCGLMGKVASSVMSHGGRVIGFMPQHLKESEPPHWAITELHLVDTMHTRKRLMFEYSDAFFVLPGGFGTLDETFEIITWRQLKLHDKPIIFININDYWTPLEELISNIFKKKFANFEHRHFFKFARTVSEGFQLLYITPEPTTHEPVADWV